MTVNELREILSLYPDDFQVILSFDVGATTQNALELSVEGSITQEASIEGFEPVSDRGVLILDAVSDDCTISSYQNSNLKRETYGRRVLDLEVEL